MECRIQSSKTAEVIGLLKGTELSGADIARLLGISRERVRQIANRAFGPNFLRHRYRKAIKSAHILKTTAKALKELEQFWGCTPPRELTQLLNQHNLRIKTKRTRSIVLLIDEKTTAAFTKPRPLKTGRLKKTYNVIIVPSSDVLVVVDVDGYYVLPGGTTRAKRLCFTERTKALRYLPYKGCIDVLKEALSRTAPEVSAAR